MMSKEKRRVPKLRFPGFTEDWEQCKLGEFVNIVSGDAPSTFISGNCIYVKVDDLNYSDRIQLSSSNLVNANPKAHLVNTGATIFPKRGAAIMTNKVRIMGQDGYLDTNMMALIPKEIDKDFLFTFIQKTGLYKIADTSTIPQINNKHIEPYMIQVPTNKEQECIGIFFEKIDKIITLHQRKLDNLKLKKKALLQKLFPKNGERYPELRFSGFTDTWEQRKLRDIVDFLDGQRKPLKESDRIKGKYPYYGASGIIDYINDYLFDENLVLLSEDGANIIDRNYPVCFIATGKYWVNNHAHVLKVKTGVIDKFICESLERLDYTKFNTGTAQPKLNQDICQKIVITIPNEDEQKCISEFLDRINNIITLHQRKLDHLKLQKKALLQQMFV